MHSEKAQTSGSGHWTVSHTAHLSTTRPFEVTAPGQEIASSPTNPFPRRPHEVWMGEPHVVRKAIPHQTMEGLAKPEQSGFALDWSRISLDVPGEPVQPKGETCEPEPSQPIQNISISPTSVLLSTPPTSLNQARIYLIGVPQRAEPPTGLSKINQENSESGFMTAMGWTGIPNSAAFTLPRLDVKESHAKKPGNVVEHFAEVLPTTSVDAQIESYYPAPGDHVMPGKTYRHIYRISSEISNLIKVGEQEHIDDAQRAYDITLKLIAEKINLLAAKGQKFGPAKTPEDANNMAWAELYQLLPPQLHTKYGGWMQMLDFLLKLTHARDENRWHTLDADYKTKGKTIIHTVYKPASAQINTVPSSKLVNYPPAKF